MVDVNEFYNCLTTNQVGFFTGVPDSLLKDICAYITDHTDAKNNIIAANEGAAVGLASGYYLATGKVPLVYMQNSGIGNAVNPILSLADEKVYKIPMVLLIGWRGEPGTKDEPQHKKQGEVTIPLLEAMGVPFVILSKDRDEAIRQTTHAVQSARNKSIPHAILVCKDTFASYKLKNKSQNEYTLSREEALHVLLQHTKSDSVIVSTTGKLSRELFEYRATHKQPHSTDFLTVGSMGHSSSIALGIALNAPQKQVYCFDGDGAFIMHMGAISNVGALAPANFCHIVFNNGSHESVGSQPTIGFQINIPQIAKHQGYKHVFTAANEKDIVTALLTIKELEGPVLLEIKINTKSRSDLGRPTSTPVENKELFMQNFK